LNSKSVLWIILKIISSRIYLFLFLQFLFFYTNTLHAQWVKTNAPNYVNCFAVRGSNIFAGTTGGGISLSTNYGKNWTDLSDVFTNTANNALVIIGENIFAGTMGSGVYLSTNNGISLTQVNNDLFVTYIFSLVASGNNIIAGSLHGLFLTTDNGANWRMSTDVSMDLYVTSLAARGSSVYAGARKTSQFNDGGVFLSLNNGSNWNITGLIKSIESLAVSESNIYAGMGLGGVYLSSDNGSNWTQAGSLANHFVNRLAVSGTNVFAGTLDDGIYISKDNGTTWSQAGWSGEEIVSLAVNDSNIIASLVGTKGTWCRTLSEIAGVSNEVNILPQIYTLFQNHPNPFNPNTVISYSLPSASDVKLIVFNSLGQTVRVLEIGYKNTGTYMVTFDATELPSGIYFYRMEAGQFSQVKKMMLIK
jgi:hypothetical protein